MILINRTETDPYFNIAAEEYVLKSFKEDVFMLWVNRPAVIIGKHQVAAAEADILHTYLNKIPVIRRISGGGTVYHDEGNLNYSLISNGEKGKLVDYLKYSGTVIRALEKQSVVAVLEGKSSLYTSGKKFSGNAEHIFRNRVLHHGTLLFNSNHDNLRKCIRPKHQGYNDKSVRSVDSRVTNLIDHLPTGFDMDTFRAALTKQLTEDFPGTNSIEFSNDDKQAIRAMVEEKYGRMEWNFGYSPRYALKKKFFLSETEIEIDIKTEKGRISYISFEEGRNAELNILSDMLLGIMHHPASIKDVLNSFKFTKIRGDKMPDELLAGLF